MMDAPVSESSWPVGSSAISSCGSLASARATATRCCWPPDSSYGRCAACAPRPTSSSSTATRSSRSAAGHRPAAAARRRSPPPTGSGSARTTGRRSRSCRRRSSSSSRSAGRGDVVAGHHDPAGGRPVQPADQVEQGGLAGAGPAADGDQLAAAGGERDSRTACTTPSPGREVTARSVTRTTGPLIGRSSPGRTATWSGSRFSRTRSRSVSASTNAAGNCIRPARSSTAYSSVTTVSSAVGGRGAPTGVPPRRSGRRGSPPSGAPAPATLRSWVTTTTVTPSSALIVRSAPKTSAAVASSSSPVGSSAKSTSGSLATATATAHRCCSPPLIWAGRRSAQ